MKKFLIFPLLIVLAGCATGSHVLTGTPHAAISPDMVKVLPSMPEKPDIIADLSSYDSAPLGTFQAGTDRCIKKLKSEAAKMGANGIVIKNNYSGVGGVRLTASAIFVP